MVLKGDWSGYDMTGGEPYDNEPDSTWNASTLGQRYLYQGLRWFEGDRLYHTPAGGYDPTLPMSNQPLVDPAAGRGDDGWASWRQAACCWRCGGITLEDIVE